MLWQDSPLMDKSNPANLPIGMVFQQRFKCGNHINQVLGCWFLLSTEWINMNHHKHQKQRSQRSVNSKQIASPSLPPSTNIPRGSLSMSAGHTWSTWTRLEALIAWRFYQKMLMSSHHHHHHHHHHHRRRQGETRVPPKMFGTVSSSNQTLLEVCWAIHFKNLILKMLPSSQFSQQSAGPMKFNPAWTQVIEWP